MIEFGASIQFALMFGAFCALCGYGIGWAHRADVSHARLKEEFLQGKAAGIIEASVEIERHERAERMARKALPIKTQLRRVQ